MVKEDLSVDPADGSENDLSDELAKQFLHPGYRWKEFELRPYTAATDLLFNQVLDRNDAPFTIFLSFIFIHVHDRDKLIELCWDKSKYRAALLDWIDELGPISTEDKTAAMNLFEEIRGWARKSSIEVIPDPAAPQKKTRATRQPRSRA